MGIVLSSLLQSGGLKLAPQQSEFAAMVVMALSFHVAAIVWIAFFLRESGLSWTTAFGLEPALQRKAVGYGVLGVLFFVPVALGWQQLSVSFMELLKMHPEAQDAVKVLQKVDLPLIERVFLGVLSILIAPMAEELMFRGILYPTLKQRGFPRAGVWITSLIFGAMHFNLQTFVPLTFFSVLLILLYEQTGSLLAPITTHSLFNLANFILVLATSDSAAPVHAP